MRHTITLRRIASGWVAQSDDPQWPTLFGTDTLPTGFTAGAAPADVLGDITRLNPDARVVLAVPHGLEG